MSMNREKRALRAIHPGEILREDVLKEMNISQADFADRLGVSRRAVNELVREKRGVSPDMALRLGRLLRGSPAFWLRLQIHWDLERAEKASEYKTIKPFPKSKVEAITA